MSGASGAADDTGGRPSDRRGLLVVLSSPSGAGKSTLSRLLLIEENRDHPQLALSISVTTRPRRPSEVEGVHYRFVAPSEFERLREGGELLEWAEVHGNLYGTPRRPVEASLAAGHDVLFDIDWQGAAQVREAAGADAVSIFVLPPSAAELRARLERRAEDDAATIARRLANAKLELGHWAEYDYVIINDEIQDALAEVRAILASERLKRWRRAAELDRFVASLVAGL